MTEEQEQVLSQGGSAGELRQQIEAVVEESDGDSVTFVGDESTLRQTYAITQLMAASLYDDDAMLDSLQRSLIAHHVQQAGLVLLSEPRTAYHFGRFVHAETVDEDGAHVCSEECVTLPAEQENADVVLMRIEFDVSAQEQDTPEIEGDDA